MYKCVSFPLPVTKLSYINFSIRRQKLKLASLIIGPFTQKKQWGTKKILVEGQNAPLITPLGTQFSLFKWFRMSSFGCAARFVQRLTAACKMPFDA
jgi:hypothetical protein